MKKLSILLSVILTIFLCSCGGKTETKKESTEEIKEEIKKETKKLSKSTKEGMMAIIDASNIDVSDELEYEKVGKKSNSYVISFKKVNTEEETVKKLDEWFVNTINELVEAGWRKKALSENEEMMGVVVNDIIMYPPDDKDIDVSYGLKLSTSYDMEKKSYSFYVSAE